MPKSQCESSAYQLSLSLSLSHTYTAKYILEFITKTTHTYTILYTKQTRSIFNVKWKSLHILRQYATTAIISDKLSAFHLPPFGVGRIDREPSPGRRKRGRGRKNPLRNAMKLPTMAPSEQNWCFNKFVYI